MDELEAEAGPVAVEVGLAVEEREECVVVIDRECIADDDREREGGGTAAGRGGRGR